MQSHSNVRVSRLVHLVLVVSMAAGCGRNTEPTLVNLAEAVIVAPAPEAPGVLSKAGEMLRGEIQARTGIALDQCTSWPADTIPAIILGTWAGLDLRTEHLPRDLEIATRPEGYTIWVDQALRTAPTVFLAGNDDRGVLFSAGQLLRTLRMRPGEIDLDGRFALSTAPAYSLRGHQLAYRPLANTYDAWDRARYEQYIRDLVVFGTNAVEFCPTLDPKETRNALMPEDPWTMDAQLAALAGSYGLDVWMFLPVVDVDVSDPGQAARALDRRRALFEHCSPMDAVFVPGGDPGDTPPEVLMPWLERLALVLREVHPQAELWVSNQGFSRAENDFLFSYLQTNQPDWLTGLVFGPWTKLTLKEERARLPGRYRLRRYPDITHCVRSQYPVPDWDRTFAHTLGREPINPRPRAQTHIHNALASLADGFITYSEGVSDDVNKIIWSSLGWDPQREVEEILAEYGRYFIGDDLAEEFARGLLALEANWEKPLLLNDGVESTLALWEDLERRASAGQRSNWRFQQGLFRACYDSYVRQRLLHEVGLEQEAFQALRSGARFGVEKAVARARHFLQKTEYLPVAYDLRKKIEALGDSLNAGIGIQLSVERQGAHGPERGAVLDFLDQPLNDRQWLERELAAILQEDRHAVRERLIDRILNWENPGPGGFYDDLGNAEKQPHLVQPVEWADDPGFVVSPQAEFSWNVRGRLSWLDQAQTLYGAPLKMCYHDLESGAAYRLRVTYFGRFGATMRLEADGKWQVHGPVAPPDPVEPLEFPIPREATADGTLELTWHLISGRGCQVAEVWLLRE